MCKQECVSKNVLEAQTHCYNLLVGWLANGQLVTPTFNDPADAPMGLLSRITLSFMFTFIATPMPQSYLSKERIVIIINRLQLLVQRGNDFFQRLDIRLGAYVAF